MKSFEPSEWKIANAIFSYCEEKIKSTQNYLNNYEYPEARANMIRLNLQLEHLKAMQRS